MARADEYFTNWLQCTSPVSLHETSSLATAAAQFTCGLLRTIHVTNEGDRHGLKAETHGAGKQLVNVLRMPSAYSDVRRIKEFYCIHHETPLATRRSEPTSQLQVILRRDASAGGDEADGGDGQIAKRVDGGSTTALAFLANVPSLREVYGRMIREMMRIGIRGDSECFCVLPGSGPESLLPSAHEPHCEVYHAASLGVELVAACICSLFIEGPTSPRLAMFHASPLRWAISKAIEQSVLTGSALISGADLMKSVLVVAGYSGDYNYGPLVVSSGGQCLVLAALNGLTLDPTTIGRVLAFPGALLHRGQYYERLVVGPRRRLGGHILRTVSRSSSNGANTGNSRGSSIPYGSRSKYESGRQSSYDSEKADVPIPPPPPLIRSSDEGAAEKIDIAVREMVADDLELVVRSRQRDGTIKEHDLWHCITAALTANMLGDCRHVDGGSSGAGDSTCGSRKGYELRVGEVVDLVSTSSNLERGVLEDGLTIAMVHGRPVDRLLACGVNVNMVVQTSGCLHCAVLACKQLRYSYIVT